MKLGFKHSAEMFGVPLIVIGYWQSLTFIDPAIAFILLKKRDFGVALAFVNIVINVIVNSSLVIVALPVMSIQTIYTGLGNIFNGLQIALLLFSVFTLPLFWVGKREKIHQESQYRRFFNYFPFITLAIGSAIHLVGLINLIQKFESFWVLWVHVSMTVINLALLFALWKRLKIGYLAGMTVFTVFGLIQAGYAGAIFIGVNCPFNLTMALTISICCLSISALLLNSNRYTVSVKQAIKRL